MKQSKTTGQRRSKPARKSRKKSQGRFKTMFKKLSKSRARLVKSFRKKNKQLRKYFKKTSKKSTQVDIAPLRLLFVSVVIAGGFFGNKIWAGGYDNLFTASPIKQTAEAPSRITTPGPAQASPLFSTYPTWTQNFASQTAGKLNPKYWNIIQGIPQNDNHEAEYYTDNPTNLHIKNGVLSLVATRQAEPDNYGYASARIDTQGKLSLLYGRIDITAKLPNGVGTWPAAWFLPANNKYEDLSPPSDSLRYLNGGEMDLIEEVGFNPNIEYGVVHTLSDQNNPNGVGAFNQVEVPNNNIQYNVYSLLWTPTSITYEVNNTPFFTYSKPADSDYKTWAFDQPFYLILNLAVGGNWGGEDTAQFPGNGIDNSILPASMDIKSIYYYPYRGQ